MFQGKKKITINDLRWFPILFLKTIYMLVVLRMVLVISAYLWFSDSI